MLIVPVGATVVTVAFRNALYSPSNVLPLKFGNEPRFAAISESFLCASSSVNDIICSPSFNASSESYGIPSITSMSAKPMTPNPIFLFARVISVISFNG